MWLKFGTLPIQLAILISSANILKIPLSNASDFRKCPGACMDPKLCREIGGTILGYCTNEKACCNDGNSVWGSCGSTLKSKSKMSFFKSPNYPKHSSGDLTCKFELELNPSTTGVRLDFLDLKMDSIPSDPVEYYQSPNTICDSDMMFIKGFNNWSPDPRCGNLTGYSILVEKETDQRTISLIFLMSSSEYKWNIRLTEIDEIQVNRLHEIVYNRQFGLGSKGTLPNLRHTEPNMRRPSLHPRSMVPVPKPVPPPPPFRFNNDQGSIDNLTLMTETLAETWDDSEGISPRIAGGENAEAYKVPWQVSIQSVAHGETSLCGKAQNMSIHVCGGSIIDERTILTSAHCFFSPSRYPHPTVRPHDLKVVVGDLDLCQPDEVLHTQDYAISAVVVHFNYIATEIVNDLAIIQLSRSIIFKEGVQPIDLADKDLNLTEVVPQLSGWGSKGIKENATYPATLQVTSNLTILSDKECSRRQREYLNFKISEDQLPGKYCVNDKGLCVRGLEEEIEAGYGDSGGPLVALPKEGQRTPPQLIGIVSHMRQEVDTETNSTFHLDYFVKVSEYKKWILMGMLPVPR